MLIAALSLLLRLQAPPDTALPFDPRPVLDTLCSREFFGRGYLKGGVEQAAWFINMRFMKLGLQGVEGYPGQTRVSSQPFQMKAVVVEEEPHLKVDGHVLKLGTEYLPDAACPSVKGRFKALLYDSLAWPKFSARQRSRAALLFKNAGAYRRYIKRQEGSPGIAVVSYKDLPAHTIADTTAAYPTLHLLEGVIPKPGQKLKLRLQSRIRAVAAQNVLAMVPGTARPDSFLIVGAHYDHLGGIGENVYFPGANDNATGTTLLLELAAWMAEHPLRYSVVFAAFSGEEAGLLGSQAFVANPPVPLNKVRFMLNLDLIGSGEDGATCVNAPAVQPDFDRLQALNKDLGMALPALRARRNAPNSDHYPFALAGVPALFLYLQGPYHYYHSVEDKPRPELTLAGFKGTFNLCRGFLQTLAGDRR